MSVSGSRSNRASLSSTAATSGAELGSRVLSGAEPAHHLAEGQEGQRPVEVEAELERAALVGPAVVVVGGGDERDHRLQRLGRLARRAPLGRAEVRSAGHADLARAPRLGGHPVDRVGAVGAVVEERIELPSER